MTNKLAVLPYSSDPITILWGEVIKKLTWVHEVLADVRNAIDWLTTNPDWKLIVSMPIEENERRTIANELQGHHDQCIAIDPAMLRHGSQALFKNTQSISWELISHLRQIIAANKKD